MVVIVIVGVAIATIAAAVVFTAGGTKILSTKTASYERAQVIAEAGLERAAAYSKAVVRNERDFDKVLDPANNINCGSPSGLAASEWGAPRYTGAGVATISFPTGSSRRFRVVPFNDGAYLTRFDDDADDGQFNFNLGAFTSNNPANGCTEGPVVANPPGPPLSLGATNGDNPFRDRNRGVWVTVIGIYPGVDPNNARHQVTLRRFISSNERAPVPIVAARSLSLPAAANLDFCSGLGDVAIDQSIGAPSLRACGFLRSGGSVTSGAPSAPASCTPQLTDACFPFGAAPGSGRVDTQYVGGRSLGSPFPPRPPGTTTVGGQTEVMNFTSACNFLLDDDGNDAGLYFWDASGSRGSPAPLPCSAVQQFVAPSTDLNALGSCWVPLMGVDDNRNVTFDPLGFGEVVGNEWQPRGAATFAGGTTATSTGFVLTHAFSNRAFPIAVQKPNWADCNSAEVGLTADPLTWDPGNPTTSTEIACSNCDGGSPGMLWGGSGAVVPLGQWHFPPGVNTAAVLPAGVYRFQGASNFRAPGLAQPSPAEDTRSQWPAVTLVFDADILFEAASSSPTGGAVGVGTKVGDYPSVIVLDGKDLTIRGDWAFAGGIYAEDVRIEGDVDVYGLIRATGTLRVDPGRRLSVYYDNDLITSPQETIVATPTRARTLP